MSKVLPYPEPGQWYIGFQVFCTDSTTQLVVPCPPNNSTSTTTMIEVDLLMEGCPGTSDGTQCHQHGICASIHKGFHRLSSCLCSEGYSGWFCQHKSEEAVAKEAAGTWLLTLSNLAFAPGVVLAFRAAMYGEALCYFAALVCSTLYHVCDQVTKSLADSPLGAQALCTPLYLEKEVLQFLDFYAATLSLWVTLVALLRLRKDNIAMFLNLFGALLIAALVQFNRTGIEVFLIPISIGIFIQFATYVWKCKRRGRPFLPRRRFTIFVGAAYLLSALAGGLIGFVATKGNYAYVHSLWHVLLAVSLALLVPQCVSRPICHGNNCYLGMKKSVSDTTVLTCNQDTATSEPRINATYSPDYSGMNSQPSPIRSNHSQTNVVQESPMKSTPQHNLSVRLSTLEDPPV